MTQRPCVGFTGYYGMRNFGDDLFGVLCAMAAQSYWRAQPSVVGPPLQDAPARSLGLAKAAGGHAEVPLGASASRGGRIADAGGNELLRFETIERRVHAAERDGASGPLFDCRRDWHSVRFVTEAKEGEEHHELEVGKKLARHLFVFVEQMTCESKWTDDRDRREGPERPDRGDGTEAGGDRTAGKEGRCPPALPASPDLSDYREGSVNATYSPE